MYTSELTWIPHGVCSEHQVGGLHRRRKRDGQDNLHSPERNPEGASQWEGVQRMLGDGRHLGSSPALSELRPRGMLRLLQEQARHSAFSRVASSHHSVVSTGRGLALVLRRRNLSGVRSAIHPPCRQGERRWNMNASKAIDALDPSKAWPALPLSEWADTYATLHMWSQMVGKARLALSPRVNHWWEVPLYVSARGLTTSPIPYKKGVFEAEFDFIEHKLDIRTSNNETRSL